MTIILLSSLAVLFILGFPIAIAIGISAASTLWVGQSIPLLIIVQRQFTSTDSFPLMAIPFFILAGTMMQAGGISRRLIDFANSLTGHITGGLGMVVIVTSMIFAAISGSSAATVSAIGIVLIPAMINHGYDRNFASGVMAVSGELGMIIPPSIAMIVYGVVTETSIGDLFIAGIFPGILIASSLLVVAYFISKKRGYTGVEKASWKDRLIAFRKAILALLMPLIILGGIYGGIFTPTEAAAVAVAYAFIVGKFVFKEIKLNNLLKILGDSVVTTSIVMFLIANAGLFGWILGRLSVPQMLAAWFTTYATNKIVFLLIINVLLLFVGMFFEATAANIILSPLLAPIAIGFGIDPIHFGIIMVVNLAVGMCTPPLGVNLFISCQIADIKLEKIVPAVLPFLITLIIDVLIISYVPAISMFLLHLLG